MAYCPNCGVELAPSEARCPLCGAPAPQPPGAGKPYPPAANAPEERHARSCCSSPCSRAW